MQMLITDRQQSFGYAPRPKLRLSEVERLIKKHRIIVPCPSRQTLGNMCEDGTFETVPRQNDRDQWLVYEESFLRWVKSLDGVTE